MREDMPSSELAARHGKTLKILPPFGAFICKRNGNAGKTGMGESAGTVLTGLRSRYFAEMAKFLHELATRFREDGGIVS